MIEVKDLTKIYGSHAAVDHISFTVNDGEIVGFLGPNGAGKTTTMNMMTGFISSTEGSVSINGFDILDNPTEAKKQLGYLPDVPPLYGDMRVTEYLDFVCDIKGVPKDRREEMIKRIMETVKITDHANRIVKNLSKGYRQRVGLAQALVGFPKVLILDEPTVGLDPKQVIEMRDVIRMLGKRHTVILSSHILGEVSAVCDRVVIINKGVIKAIDTIENLEKSVSGNILLHVKIKGSKTKAASIIELTNGVKEISAIDAEGNDFFAFTVVTEGDADTVKNDIMAELIKNGIQISEIFSEKPNLEEVFVKLINAPEKRKGLEELLDEMPDNSEESEKSEEDKN